MEQNTTTIDAETGTVPPPPVVTGIYEVTCHSVEIAHLICYATHRLTLTSAQADALNAAQPNTVRFIGI